MIGKELGKSSWKLIDQLTIDQFAKSTGDYQWIHVDLEKAKKVNLLMKGRAELIE